MKFRKKRMLHQLEGTTFELAQDAARLAHVLVPTRNIGAMVETFVLGHIECADERSWAALRLRKNGRLRVYVERGFRDF
jgi:hypothetical protein